MLTRYILILGMLVVLNGCASVPIVQDDGRERITVGMSSPAVTEILGSPSTVSTDEEQRKVWIYDKVPRIVTYSSSRSGEILLLVGGAGEPASEEVLTVIIKFDHDGKVSDFTYHTSRF